MKEVNIEWDEAIPSLALNVGTIGTPQTTITDADSGPRLPRLVSCNGLAGGGELGVIQSGFELVHRCGDLNLGFNNPRANRHLTGWKWNDEFSDDPNDWHTPRDVDFVYGNPPCAGFSTMSAKEFRGIHSPANVHMHKFTEYAARVAPSVAAFESVQQAFTGGRELMQILRDKMEATSGHQYDLVHLKHNNASLGGAANRPRYFWVATRIPFGVEYPEPDLVPTLKDSLGDLQGMHQTWEKQPYRYPETWWSSRRRSPDGATDGHIGRKLTHAQRIHALLDALDGEWPEGWREEDACRAIYAKYGRLPDIWQSQQERLIRRNFDMGFNQLQRWKWNAPARVLTGAALDQAMHPTEPRLFTHREAARIQGYPDNWRLWPLREVKSAPRQWGKGVPADAGRWLGYWVKRALEGDPGTMRGEPIGDRERLLSVDKGFKKAMWRQGKRRHEFYYAPTTV